MARPQRIGIDYFSFDVDMFDDEKVLPVSVEYGAKGELIIIRLLCTIYRQGYFIQWSEGVKFKLANSAKVSENLVSDVVFKLVKYHFFDEELFNKHQIITSTGIQKRWNEATRKRVDLANKPYWLISENSISGGRNSISGGSIPPENPLNLPETTQSKLNQSKLNQSKLSLSEKEERYRIFQFFVFEKNVKEPYIEMDRFYTHYQSTGWLDANGNKIIDKLSKAKQWRVEKPGLRCDIETLNKWKQVFNIVHKKSGDTAYWLLHFIPVVDTNVLYLKYQKVKHISIKHSVEIVENKLGEHFFEALKCVFKDVKLKYTIQDTKQLIK